MKRLLRLAVGSIGVPLLLVACTKPEPVPEAVRSVRTVTVAAADVGGTQDYAAEIRARSEVRLAFRVGGKMQSRQAEVGQRVKAGDVLARLVVALRDGGAAAIEMSAGGCPRSRIFT